MKGIFKKKRHLWREKIVAAGSKKVVIIVDESKVVQQLGGVPLSVEISPFAFQSTLRLLHDQGYHATLKEREDGIPYQTDNSNFIALVHFNTRRESPEEDHSRLISIPGVLETGFFLNLVGQVIVGQDDGKYYTIN